MKKWSVCLIYFFMKTAVVFAEVLFIHRTEGQSADFSCPPEGPASSLKGFKLSRLYPGVPAQQTTLLSVWADSSPSLELDLRLWGRLVVASGGLGAWGVNLTLTDLQPSDTGLYNLELTSSSTANGSDRSLLTCPQVLLLVEGTDRQCHQCSSKYTSLLYSIFAATVLLLLMSTWLARKRWMRARCRQKPPPPHPIYEEMNSKSERRGAGSPQNITTSTSHMETAFPVYSNLGIRQAEDNYYACPRQITHPLML
ncbi:unnamed protein product [Boreogadus saida]